MLSKKQLYYIKKVSCIAVLIALLNSFPGLVQATADEPTDVPLIRLVAVPDKYNGVLVRTIGFVRLEFEGNVIYPHREDYEYSLIGNGIWLDIDEKVLKQENSTRVMKYCLVVATFDANDRGHLGLWSGSLKNIKRLEVWSDSILGVNRGHSLLKNEE